MGVLRLAAVFAVRIDLPLASVGDLVLTGDGQLYTASRAGEGLALFRLSGTDGFVLQGQAGYRSALPMPGADPALALIARVGMPALLIPVGLDNGQASAQVLGADGGLQARVRFEAGAAPPRDLLLLLPLDAGPAPRLIGVSAKGRLLSLTLSAATRPAMEVLPHPVPQTGGPVSALALTEIAGTRHLLTASTEGNTVVNYGIG